MHSISSLDSLLAETLCSFAKFRAPEDVKEKQGIYHQLQDSTSPSSDFRSYSSIQPSVPTKSE